MNFLVGKSDRFRSSIAIRANPIHVGAIFIVFSSVVISSPSVSYFSDCVSQVEDMTFSTVFIGLIFREPIVE